MWRTDDQNLFSHENWNQLNIPYLFFYNETGKGIWTRPIDTDGGFGKISIFDQVNDVIQVAVLTVCYIYEVAIKFRLYASAYVDYNVV